MTKQIPESLNTEHPEQKSPLREFLCEMQAKIEEATGSSEDYLDLASLKNELIDFIKASSLDDRAKDYLTLLTLRTDPDRFKEEFPSVEALYKRLKKYDKPFDEPVLAQTHKQIFTKRRVIRGLVGAGILTAIALLSECNCGSCTPKKGGGADAPQGISKLDIPDTPDLTKTPPKQIPKDLKKELGQPVATTHAGPEESKNESREEPKGESKKVEMKERIKKEIRQTAILCGWGKEHALQHFGLDFSQQSEVRLESLQRFWQRAVDQNPEDYRSNHELALVFLAQDEDDAAFNQFFKLFQMYRDRSDFNQVLSMLVSSRHVTAKNWLSEGLKKYPNNTCVLQNAGFYHLKRGDYSQAEKYLQKVVQSEDPAAKDMKPSAYVNLGLISAFQGDYKTAKSYLKKALRLDANMGLTPRSSRRVRAMIYEIQAIESDDDVKFIGLNE